MGKASKWFRGLLGLKKPDSLSTTTTSAPKPPKEKRRWSFVKSYREKDSHHATTSKSTEHHARDTYGEVTVQSTGQVAPEQHAIAVAAATAAVAEAAVAAANAAAAVVRLTSSGSCGGATEETAAYVAGGSGTREEWAAVKIQAAFRGCLARRALRALKGLVKLQALVRGHIERKRTAVWLQRMQALLRAQAQVRAGRQFLQTSYSSAKSSTLGPATPEKFESPIRSKSMKYEQWVLKKRNGSNSCGNRSDRQVDEQSWTQRKSSIRTSSTDDEKSVRILEIDSGKHVTSKRRSLFNSTSHHALASDHYSHSVTSRKEPTSIQSDSHNEVIEESPFCTADNSPQFLSATSKDDGFKRSPFTTPSKSDGSRSYLSGCSDYYPSYMAYTESSKAKVRSLSAPKQRPPYERSNSTSNGYTHTACALHASFASKAYPGSGRLDKFGMPLGYRY